MGKIQATYYYDINKTNNLKELFDLLEKDDQDRTVIKYMERRRVIEVSAKEFFSDIKARVSYLHEKNLAGKKIAIIGKNNYEWIVTYSAIVYIGSVAVLLSKDFNHSEIRKYCFKTDVEAILYEADLAEQVGGADLPSQVPKIAMEEAYSDTVYDLDMICVNVDRDDLACILFTSGTTGDSKAVMLSQKALIADFNVNMTEYSFESQLATLPFHHLAGFSVVFTTIFHKQIFCIGETPTLIFRYLEKMKPQCTFAVPALLEMIRDKMLKYTPEELPWDLKCISCGGAKFQKEHLEAFVEYGIEIWQIYAASETGGQGLLLLMELDHLDAMGKTGPGMETDIMDGELVIRGDTIMMGYYGEPELSSEVLKDGWYHTGDLCEYRDGYYYLIGRKKNLIILSNGENISPEEIENAIVRCPDVSEVMVFENHDRISAEVYPVYTEGENEESIKNRIDAYIDTYNKSVPSYKQICFTYFRNTPFEKTSVGKIKRQR